MVGRMSNKGVQLSRISRKNGHINKLTAVPERFTPDWLERMDARYAAVRVLRERFRALAEDQGGLDQL